MAYFSIAYPNKSRYDYDNCQWGYHYKQNLY